MAEQIKQKTTDPQPVLTGPTTSHFCGFVIPKIFGRGDSRRLWILTVEYFDMSPQAKSFRGMGTGRNMIKLPGGMGEKGETLEMTRDRELRDEVLKWNAKLEYDAAEKIFHIERLDKEHHPGGIHRKQFWAIIELVYKDRLRDEPRLEPDGNILGQPVWRQAKHLLADNAMHWDHQSALRATIDALAGISADMYGILRADLLVA